jgi:hypothetical protein
MTRSEWADRNCGKVVNDTIHIAMKREHRMVLFALAHHRGAAIAAPRNQIFEVHFSPPFKGRRKMHGGTSSFPCTLPACRIAVIRPVQQGRSTMPKIGAGTHKFKNFFSPFCV